MAEEEEKEIPEEKQRAKEENDDDHDPDECKGGGGGRGSSKDKPVVSTSDLSSNRHGSKSEHDRIDIRPWPDIRATDTGNKRPALPLLLQTASANAELDTPWIGKAFSPNIEDIAELEDSESYSQ